MPERQKPQSPVPPLQQVQQAVAQELERVREHLSWLGYDTRLHSDRHIRAVHAIRPCITVELDVGFGLLVSTGYTAGPAATNDRQGYLELLNRINREAILIRLSADEEASLIIASFFTGSYSRTEFNRFIEVFTRELSDLRENTDIGKYVGEEIRH
jgi:hypothetical protein